MATQHQQGNYYSGQGNPQQSYDSQQLPPRTEKKGGLGGLLSKFGGKHSSSSPQPQYGGGYAPQQQGYPQQQYGGYPPQQQGYPPQGYPQQGYPPQGYGAGYQQAPPRRHGGMGAAGGAALGLGGGLLGGALLADAFDGGDGGGDYGGGDDGGGDYGGDGGGDGGGGD